jgi:hypothetical protein
MLQGSNVARIKCCRDQMLQGSNVAGIKCFRDKMLQGSNVAAIEISGIKYKSINDASSNCLTP